MRQTPTIHFRLLAGIAVAGVSGIVSVTLISVDGILLIARGTIPIAGFLNGPVAVVLWTVLFLGTLAVTTAPIASTSMLIEKRTIISVAAVLTLVIVMLVETAVGTRSVPKIVRDIAFLLLAIQTYAFVTALRRASPDGRLLVRVFLVSAVATFAIGSFAALVTGTGSVDGRFAGPLATPSLFGTFAALLALAATAVLESRLLRGTVHVLGLLGILMSGTRAALVLWVVSFLVLWGEQQSRRSLMLLALPAVGAVALLLPQALELVGSSNVRIVSSADIESGSLATRAFWTLELLSAIKATSYVGGMGAGSAEQLIGTLPHFDLLRIWYDYGVVALCIISALIVLQLARREAGRVSLGIILAAGMFGLTGIHNGFQTPSLTFGFSCLMAVLAFRAAQHSSTQTSDT